MRKLSLILSMAIVCAITFSACKKSEDKNTTPATTNPNPTPNPNPNPNPVNTWNWTGTAPFSVKDDGSSFDTDASSISVVEYFGYINIIVYDTKGENAIGVSLLSSVEAGKEYTMPSPCNISYTNQVAGKGFSASTGKYKIISKTANSIEGQFYADMFDPTGGTETKKLTEGYFKVTY